MHRIAAGAIVERDGRLLLVRHQRAGRYDFWVCPGGGVKGNEELHAAATREVKEESGLEVRVSKLLYIEELFNPECRQVKFWFSAEYVAGQFSTSHPEAEAEHITQAAWLLPSEFPGKTIFPSVLVAQYWQDRERSFPGIVHLPLRRMDFW